MLEYNLLGYEAHTDYKLMDGLLNIDTLTYYFDPRNSIYVNMIGIVSIDSSEIEQGFQVDKVFMRGDTVADKEFETYFMNQYKIYIDSLIKSFPILLDSIGRGCSRGLIHQRKIRFCG